MPRRETRGPCAQLAETQSSVVRALATAWGRGLERRSRTTTIPSIPILNPSTRLIGPRVGRCYSVLVTNATGSGRCRASGQQARAFLETLLVRGREACGFR